ncbi:hypothetical protein SUGI_1107940 [Cryptomeria japonica]|nr:hypothetical protein SUGI_1107940 [Cryptomeria japonica]
MKANGQDQDDLESGSPHLWRPGSTSYPTSLPHMYPMSARAEEIAKGRQELIKMFEGMPESSYELSLSDLVEQKDAMQNKCNEQANTETEESEERSTEKESKKKTRGSHRGGSTKKIGEDSKQFLLNIFVPSSLTSRSHRSMPRTSSSKSEDSEKGSGNKHNFTYIANLLKTKTAYSSMGSSVDFSKLSPKPANGKIYQALPASSMEDCHSSRIWKLVKLNRCSLCYGHTFLSRTDCQECKRSFCKNCVKVSIECTAEGKKCYNNCKGQFNAVRYSEGQLNRCMPFLALNRAKSERKSKFSLKDQENDFHSI